MSSGKGAENPKVSVGGFDDVALTKSSNQKSDKVRSNKKSSDNTSLLYTYIRNGASESAIKTLILKDKTLLSKLDSEGETALDIAVEEKNYEAVNIICSSYKKNTIKDETMYLTIVNALISKEYDIAALIIEAASEEQVEKARNFLKADTTNTIMKKGLGSLAWIVSELNIHDSMKKIKKFDEEKDKPTDLDEAFEEILIANAVRHDNGYGELFSSLYKEQAFSYYNEDKSKSWTDRVAGGNEKAR
ncbi:ankyrin repeat domain-containing protein [Rickettsiales bacterium]|nr:ankyrin repeat domain-containing protein [Rickettsiales bacterium]